MRVINAPILGVVDANVVQNVTQGIVGDPIDVDDVSKEFYVAIATGLAGLLFSVLTGLYSCFVDRKLKQYEAKLEIQKDRLTRFEDLKQLMRLYKKPLVQSAFDLQSRLAQEVRGDLLRTFNAQGGRRKKYALHSTLYLICEFLGWLEVIRQEIVFITGRNAATLNQILDAIRFQFSGETEIQGVPTSRAPRERDADDQAWSILQLFGVELRAIGEVMLDVRSYEDSKEHTGLSVIGYAEFTRRYTKEPPKQEDFGIKVEAGADGKAAGSAAAAAPDTAGSGGDGDAEAASKYAEAMERWEDSKEKLLKDTIRPLTKSVKKLMNVSDVNMPQGRLVMLQVLLCKLIEFLDDGEKGEDNADIEERYLARNDRITPLVARLSPDALLWLATRPFMEDCTDQVHPTYRKQWLDMVGCGGEWALGGLGCDKVPLEVYRRLAFPGFREDRRSAWREFVGQRARGGLGQFVMDPVDEFRKVQSELDKTGTFFPGAFPPRVRRSTAHHPYYWLPMKLRHLAHQLHRLLHLCVTGVLPVSPEDPLLKLYEQRRQAAADRSRAGGRAAAAGSPLPPQPTKSADPAVPQAGWQVSADGRGAAAADGSTDVTRAVQQPPSMSPFD